MVFLVTYHFPSLLSLGWFYFYWVNYFFIVESKKIQYFIFLMIGESGLMTNYYNESQALYMTRVMLNLSFEGVTVSSPCVSTVVFMKLFSRNF